MIIRRERVVRIMRLRLICLLPPTAFDFSDIISKPHKRSKPMPNPSARLTARINQKSEKKDGRIWENISATAAPRNNMVIARKILFSVSSIFSRLRDS